MKIETETLDRKNSIYFGFANGIMQENAQNVATDTDTAQTRNDDNMTYNALSAKAFGGEPLKKYYSGASGFQEADMLQLHVLMRLVHEVLVCFIQFTNYLAEVNRFSTRNCSGVCGRRSL